MKNISKSIPGKVMGKKTIQSEETEYINKYKFKIVPHPFSFEIYESYLKENFDYKEITDFKTDRNKIHLEIFKSNLKSCFPNSLKADPVFIEVIKNNKSEDLYNEDNKRETIFIYIDKITGYYETNSDFISNKLSLLRGVNEEEYNDNSPQLLHLITIMNLNTTDN